MKITHMYDRKFITVSAFAALLYGALAAVTGINIFCALGIGALLFISIFLRFRITDSAPWWVKQLIIISFSFIVFCLIQFAVGAHIFSMNPIKFILNIVLFYSIIAIISAITSSIKAGVLSFFLFSLFLAIVDHFVVQTRSYEIQFSDIMSIFTAMSVAGGYTYTMSSYCLGALFVSLPFLVILIANKYPKISGLRPRIILPVVGVIFISVIAALVTTQAGSSFIGYRTKYWKYRTSEYNGFYIGLIKSISATSIKRPQGYSADTLASGLKSLLGEDVTSDSELTADRKPNVIVIMNETFSDLQGISQSLGYDLKTSSDPLTYFNSFRDSQPNVIRGNAYASIYGGNTANSEFEFLTGNSMAFIEQTSVAYNNILNESNSFSIVDIFNQYGYYTVGMHPEDKTNWSRNKIYEFYGFDEQYFLRVDNTFVDTEKLNDNQMYRNHVSDKTVYEKIIGLYERKEEGVPIFTFAVTMQNHGGYSTDNFDYTVNATESSISQLNEYLSCVNESDKALPTLFEYFESVDEDTIIVFFGDHQPSLPDAVYEQYMGLNGDSSTEESMSKYIVPYLIWANYDLSEQDDGDGHDTSLNYLSSRLLNILGFKSTAYLSLVQNAEKEAPVLNAFGWRDNNGTFHTIDAIKTIDTISGTSGMYDINQSLKANKDTAPVIMIYYWTEYNMLKDTNNKLTEYFMLNYNSRKSADISHVVKED